MTAVELFDSFTLADLVKVALGLFRSHIVQREHLLLKQEFFEKLKDLILSQKFDRKLLSENSCRSTCQEMIKVYAENKMGTPELCSKLALSLLGTLKLEHKNGIPVIY